MKMSHRESPRKELGHLRGSGYSLCLCEKCPAKGDSLYLYAYVGPEGLQFDDDGMVLPHSILGSLEDFRSYLQAKGETDLVKRIPKSFRDLASEPTRRPTTNVVQRKVLSSQKNIQSNALQQWKKQMKQRRVQQDLLSYVSDRPVDNLLMNQANHFRETQEQREILNKVMPLVHSGFGYRVGSEFWSLPQRYGDEMSGIAATLTQAELGRQKPVTHVGIPNSIRQELGITSDKKVCSASQTWDQSAYLQHKYQELSGVLQDLDIKKPDIGGLEVIGSGKPFIPVCQSLLDEKEQEDKEIKEKFDPLTQRDDVQAEAHPVPALRFCGELARWTGNSVSNQGEVGISATIFFEAQTGEIASSHMELHNEGSAAIFYGWQQLPVPHSFPHLCPQTKKQHFYFNSSSGVIHPGDTKQVEFIFKSEKPGIKTEFWQLNTNPVLLQGASIQLKLRGVALCQDKTADQRLFLETKLEKVVVEKICRSLVSEVVQRVQSPKRPGSPAELYTTEEQQFRDKNPKLQYFDQPVEDLKRLWKELNRARPWDLSVDTLRQVVLSLPDEVKTPDYPTKEESLVQLNLLLLQLSEPSDLNHWHLSALAMGQQLWKNLLDTMCDQDVRLRNLLGLPEKEMWTDKKSESINSDPDLHHSLLCSRTLDSVDDPPKEEKNEKKAGVGAETEKALEESKKKGKRKDDTGKHSREKQGKDSSSAFDTHSTSPCDRRADSDIMHTYSRILHKQVYVLVEDLLDNLCDLLDEMDVGDGTQSTERGWPSDLRPDVIKRVT